jgi:heat shock protein HtpX
MNFEIFPIATIALASIAGISYLVAVSYYDKILLSGSNYIKIDPNSDASLPHEYKKVYDMVEAMKLSAGLKGMPDVYILKEDYMNAFASGWNETNSIVCVTEGLIRNLKRDEVQAVIAHEISHIKHGDIKLTLLIGVMTNVVVTVVDIVAHMFGDSKNKNAQFAKMILFVLNLVLPLITMVLQMYLSRKREYMADAGAVRLMKDNTSMINALKKISGDYQMNKDRYAEEDTNKSRKAAYIFNESFSEIFSTHPAIDKRILALGGSTDGKINLE